MAWSTLDLSAITDELIDMLKACIASWEMWQDNGGPIARFDINVSGSMPETVRKEGRCQLSMYLLHAEVDKTVRNTPILSATPQGNLRHPLSLDLYYILTAFADKNYNQEQQAMSIAMRCLHEHSIVTSPSQEFNITIDPKSADEMSRIWQGMVTPLRFGMMYRVAVIPLTPTHRATVPGPPPTTVGLTVAPADIKAVAAGGLYGVAAEAIFDVPPGTTDAGGVGLEFQSSIAAPGSTILVSGVGLDGAAFANWFLTVPGGAETDITAWLQPAPLASEARLRLPATVGAMPANTPPPGLYLLSAGSGPPPVRSNAIPLPIAARVDVTATPPVLTPDGSGTYHLQGAGFTPSATEVILDTVALALAAGPLGAGEFQVDGAGTAIDFKAPTNLDIGRYHVRVRVNQIESAPSWYIEV